MIGLGHEPKFGCPPPGPAKQPCQDPLVEISQQRFAYLGFDDRAVTIGLVV
jgi:hypothetical protein